MSDIAIKAENLSKRYHLGQFVGYRTLRESLVNTFSAPFRRFRPAAASPKSKPRNPDSEYIWAIKDVSFQVKQGEAIGIIGRNGAGKTTLLKVLCRITEPTEGYAEIHGRVGSLLEVGTGFHPELTGRENIYLNGAVLGMKKKEIDRKFDDMVEFAEVQKFIDTPLKRYSTGMQVRLAFSVAAHMVPEVLLVDEVLAVGDYSFQKKCLGRMRDVAGGGRTVLFVSHNMQAISTLCDQTILLDAGRVAMIGPTSQVVETYLQDRSSDPGEVVWDFDDAPGSDTARVHAIRILNSQGQVSSNHDAAEPVTMEMEFWVLHSKGEIHPTFHLYNAQGIRLFSTSSIQDPNEDKRFVSEPGLYRCWCTIPGNYLNQGQHWVSVFLSLNRILNQANLAQVVSFSVNDLERTVNTGIGAVRPFLPWTIQQIKESHEDGHPMKIRRKGE